VNTKSASVLGYIRVSTEAQADGGVSLAAQREKLKAYAIAMDLQLVDIVEDAGVSAKSLTRPGLQSALARLESGEACGLIVTKLDRLTRSVRDLGDLVQRYFGAKYSLLSVGDAVDTRSAAGRLVLNVLTSVAEWEREAGAERTRDALAHVKKQGGRLGREALGWRRTDETDHDGRRCVTEIDGELATVARILELRENGLSLPAIARALTVEGRATKCGGRWAPETVRRILVRATAGRTALCTTPRTEPGATA
jgi:site-specific DNA recombinase